MGLLQSLNQYKIEDPYDKSQKDFAVLLVRSDDKLPKMTCDVENAESQFKMAALRLVWLVLLLFTFLLFERDNFKEPLDLEKHEVHVTMVGNFFFYFR